MRCCYYCGDDWFYASLHTVAVISKGLIVMQDIILPQLSKKKSQKYLKKVDNPIIQSLILSVAYEPSLSLWPHLPKHKDFTQTPNSIILIIHIKITNFELSPPAKTGQLRIFNINFDFQNVESSRLTAVRFDKLII